MELLSFPNPVDEKAARTVAGVVLATVIAVLLTGSYWLLIGVAYGFWARLLTGPKLSSPGWGARTWSRRGWAQKNRRRVRRSRSHRGSRRRCRRHQRCSVGVRLARGGRRCADRVGGCGGLGVDLRLLPWVQAVRRADASRCGARIGMRRVRRRHQAAWYTPAVIVASGRWGAAS